MIDLPRQPEPRLFGTQAWPKAAVALHLLATHGSGMRYELAEILGQQFEITPDSGSLARLWRQLGALGLTVTQDFSVIHRLHLAAIRLTETGKAYCAALGWAAVENDWERLLRLHSADTQVRHAGACLAFAYQARRRGWAVELLPQTGKSRWYPDALVSRGSQRHYVEVELGTQKAGKWEINMKHQRHVAICARTPTRLVSMVDECALVSAYGIGTDLLTLARSSAESPLWSEWWNDDYNQNYIPRPEFRFGKVRRDERTTDFI